jgi:tetratricopeptide (TPR) repeat protein
MSFDKVKAMRSAERFLAQGKIRAAISEYKQVVEHDPRDFSTLNMLGDLYAKNSEEKEAVNCFRKVAEHYGKQGFAQKAIAVYNKISRIQPGSLEVSAKLAELYHIKGSFAEARTHYLSLAESYQNKGKKLDAVAVWKRIAELDPANTDIYLKIAEAYWQENQKEEAASAFIEAGTRLAAQNNHEAALTSFSRALEIAPNDSQALNGLVKTQITLGFSEDAAKTLENILLEQPDKKEIYYLLADCYLDMNNPSEAERVITQLLYREPADYPKLLGLTDVYLKNNDLDSAVRILLVTAEQLLVGGKADELTKWLNEILIRNPEQMDSLHLLVRVGSWQRDPEKLKEALERLAEVARANDSIDDERYALSQLVIVAPQENGYAARLQEIITEHGYVEVATIDAEFAAETASNAGEEATFEHFQIVHDDAENDLPITSFENFEAMYAPGSGAFEYDAGELSSGSPNGSFENFQSVETDSPEAFEVEEVSATEIASESSELSLSEEYMMRQELEGVEFYIAQGYKDFAEKTLVELEEKYGNHAEFTRVRGMLDDSLKTLAEKSAPEPQPEKAETNIQDQVAAVEHPAENGKSFNILDEFRSELDLEDDFSHSEGDYETHYHLAIAYKEMGLMEESIKEFQDAINLVHPDDGTRRFFHCANLLGLCFMEKQMPNLAIMWYRRGLETKNLSDEEQQALLYEIANAYETGGEEDKARDYFEKVYAVDIDYRDTRHRLQNLQEKIIQ